MNQTKGEANEAPQPPQCRPSRVAGPSRDRVPSRSAPTLPDDLEHAAAEPVLERLGLLHRYHPTVFFTPPRPEIFHADPERRQGWDEAAAEYERLARSYPELGYRVVVLAKTSVQERADAVLAELSARERNLARQI
jgi:predicted ATPase